MTHRSERPPRERLHARRRRRIAVRTLTLTLICNGPAALADPSGGVVVGGSGSIGGSVGAQVITQQSARLAIDWQAFSLAAGERVEFRQPAATAVALNRVVGGQASEIHGQILANGQVFLVNPSGVLFGRSAQVDVGGLVASALDLSARDFLAGRTTFSATGGDARVVNEGRLQSAEGGYVALLGRQVVNAGTIDAPRGQVALAAGDQVSLSLDAQRLVDVSVDRATLEALVENRGAIHADGGRVLLTARARDALLDTVVNNDGVIEADSVGTVGGVIRLSGGTEGVVASRGTLAARGLAADERGGHIEITGERVALTDTAEVNASGLAGGGRVEVGGSREGAGPLPNSREVFVGANARLEASGGGHGDGGSVVVYAEDNAVIHGHIAARGGAQGGQGGFVETSGKRALDLGTTPDVTAAFGDPGLWLIDPINIVISAIASQCTGLAGCVNGPAWTSNAAGATLGANLITAALNAGQNVTITTGATGLEDGNITLLGSPVIRKSAGAADVTLTLSAHNDIGVTAAITRTGSAAVGRLNVVLTADSDNNGFGNVALRAGVTTGGGTLTASGQNITVLSDLRTSGSAGRNGGDVTLTAGPNGALDIAGGIINASGGAATGAGLAGGNVTLAGGTVIARGITANGGAAGAANQPGGRAGRIAIDATGAAAAVVLNGNLTARGGNAGDGGAGGDGGSIALRDPITLGAAVVVDTAGGSGAAPGAGGDVSLGRVDSSAGARRAFSVNAGNGTLVAADLGAASPLGTVTLRAGGGLSTGDITTSGRSNEAGFAVTLDGGSSGSVSVGDITTRGTTTTGIGRAGGTVTATGRTVDAGRIDTTGADSLIASAGGAGGAVRLTAQGAGARLTLAQDIVANGGNGRNNPGGASGAVSLDGPVTLAGDIVIASRPGEGTATGNAGRIGFTAGSTLDSDTTPRSLVLDGRGSVELPGAIGQLAPLVNLEVAAAAPLVLPTSRLLGDLAVVTNGAISSSGPLVVDGNTRIDAGTAALALDDAANDFRGLVTLRAAGGGLTLNNAGDLRLGSSLSAGDFLVTAGGDIQVAPAATLTSTNGDLVLAARGARFVNEAGTAAIATPNGRWLIYAETPAGNVPNGLVPGNARPNFYGRTFDSAPPVSMDAGNHFVFAIQPTLRVSLDAAGKIFGDPDPAGFGFTSSGLLAGDTLADAFDATLARVAGERVGDYAIDATAATSPIGYALDVVPTSFTIAPRPVTLAANAVSRVYGDADPALGFSVQSGTLVATPDGALAGAPARAPGEDVGRYSIGQGTLANPNYALRFVPGNFDITPRSLSLAATALTKIFGDPDPALAYTVTAGTLATLPGGALTGALARAPGETVGAYAIAQGTLDNPNYALSFAPATLAIAPRAVTLAAAGTSKIYGDPDPALGVVVTAGSLAGIPEGVLDGALVREVGEDVGRYAIARGTLGNPNYRLVFESGTFDILPRPLFVQAMDSARAVGAPNPAFGSTFENFAFDEDRSVLLGAIAYTTAADLASPPGSYTVTPFGLTAANYALRFLDGTLTVFVPTEAAVAPGALSTASDDAIVAARQTRPGLPPIAALARLQIVDEGILLPADLR